MDLEIMLIQPKLLAALLLCSCAPVFAQQGCSDRVTDSTGFDSSTADIAAEYGQAYVPEPSNPQYVRTAGTSIGRVVGPGTPDTFNSDGTLKNWDTYVLNHVVSETANVSLTAFIPEQPFLGLRVALFVNGYREADVSFGSSNHDAGSTKCVQVSTRHFHFAQLAPPGQTPGPFNGYAGGNDFEIQMLTEREHPLQLRPDTSFTVWGSRVERLIEL